MRGQWRSDARQALARIGGPNSVTWPGLLILLAVGLPVVMAGGWNQPADVRIGYLAVGIAAPLISYAVLALARVTVLRGASRRPMPGRTVACYVIAVVVALLVSPVVGGAMRAQSAAPADSAPPDPVVIIGSVLGTLVGATMVLCLAAIIVDSWREYRTRDRRLRELRSQADLVRTQAAASIEEQNAATAQAVGEVLIEQVTSLTAADAQGSAERLRATALDVVRPLSHELALGEASFRVPAAKAPRADLGQFVADATALRLIPPFALAVLTTVPVAFYAALQVSVRLALPLALATFAVILGVSWLANQVFARVSARLGTAARVAWLLMALAAVTAATLVVWQVLGSAESADAAWGVMACIIPVVGITLPAVTALRAVQARQQSELAAVTAELDWQVARARELQWVRRTALARALHGPVQSAAMAAALRLESAVRGGTLSEGVLDEVRSWLVAALEELNPGADRPVSLPEVFERLQGMWSGVCEVAIAIEQPAAERLAADAVSSRAVADVLEEGCANAVQHGAATRVSVDIRLGEPLEILVTLRDDGQSGDAHRTAGLGSRLLDAVTLSWHRESGPVGSVLQAVIPIQ